MARKCSITGVSRQHGHRVSHANNKTNHVFYANIQPKRIWVEELGRFVKIKLSTNAMRTIDKIGLSATLKKYGINPTELV